MATLQLREGEKDELNHGIVVSKLKLFRNCLTSPCVHQCLSEMNQAQWKTAPVGFLFVQTGAVFWNEMAIWRATSALPCLILGWSWGFKRTNVFLTGWHCQEHFMSVIRCIKREARDAVASFSPNRTRCIAKNLSQRLSEWGRKSQKVQRLQFVQTKDFKIVFLYPDYQMIVLSIFVHVNAFKVPNVNAVCWGEQSNLIISKYTTKGLKACECTWCVLIYKCHFSLQLFLKQYVL